MIDLEAHANSILRAAGSSALNHYMPKARESILAACTALFDAGALAMREGAAFGAECFNAAGAGDCCDATVDALADTIRAIDPATFRTKGTDHD